MRHLIGLLFALGFALPAEAAPRLKQVDVNRIFAQAISAAKTTSPNSVIAVTDREGFVLGVWDVNGGGSPSRNRVGAAIREAGTAAYLSSDKNAFTSRTAQFIIQQNFPPGVRNRVPGPLVGVAFSNLPFSDINHFKHNRGALDANGIIKPNTGIANTRLSGRCASAPLYMRGSLVGGIGVFNFASGGPTNVEQVELDNEPAGENIGEAIALAGQKGFAPQSKIFGSGVLIDGFRVPYVLDSGIDTAVQPLGSIGKAVPNFPLRGSPKPFNYPKAVLGGEPGEIRFPIVADAGAPIRGQNRLSANEVRGIIARAAARAGKTRAGIRLPPNQKTKVWITVVGNPNKNGVPAPILGIFRMNDATLFSFDVSAQKARTALFFSNDNMAMSTRTVGFLSQDNFPPGLDSRGPGPYGPATNTTNNPGFQVRVSGGGNPNLPNGVTVFPGGFPLYRNGVLIGAVGISGDGVDQDDLAGFVGCGEFVAPKSIRADQFLYKGARLPFVKFPRNPAL